VAVLQRRRPKRRGCLGKSGYGTASGRRADPGRQLLPRNVVSDMFDTASAGAAAARPATATPSGNRFHATPLPLRRPPPQQMRRLCG